MEHLTGRDNRITDHSVCQVLAQTCEESVLMAAMELPVSSAKSSKDRSTTIDSNRNQDWMRSAKKCWKEPAQIGQVCS